MKESVVDELSYILFWLEGTCLISRDLSYHMYDGSFRHIQGHWHRSWRCSWLGDVLWEDYRRI